MTIDYRIRNIVIAAALAAAAVLLTVIYVSSAREEEKAAKTTVTVYVPSKDYALGTAGSKIAGNLKAVTVNKDQAVPQAVASPADVKGLYTIEPVYAGEQLSLRRFALPLEQGIRAKLAGKQRALQVPGDTNQVLAGTLVPGDRVDVVASMKDPKNVTSVKSTIVLRNLRVLQTEDGEGGATIEKPEGDDHVVILAVTDAQAQRLFYVMTNGDWSLQLRPVKKPKDSSQSVDTYPTVIAGTR
jgi:pilus assembly protein CpaB